jgi:transposase
MWGEAPERMSKMETMASKSPRPRRSFSDEFKAEVVELVRQPGKTVGGVARELDLTETAVRAWVKQADIDDGRRSDGLTSAERAEMAQLRKELREVREERDILKRAVAFFARETR